MYTRPRQQAPTAERNGTVTPGGSGDPYASACEAALSDLTRALADQARLRSELRAADRRVADMRPLASGLFAQCTRETRELLTRHYGADRLFAEEACARGGDLGKRVRRIFRERGSAPTGAAEVIETIRSDGDDVAPKAVYNAIQRLALGGHLVRVSRGRYLAPGHGIAVETPEDFG